MESVLQILEVLDAGTASSNVAMLPSQGPMTIQGYSADWDTAAVVVQGSIDGVAWSTLGTLAAAATANFIAVTSIWSQISLVCDGGGTAAKTMVVKARIYI